MQLTWKELQAQREAEQKKRKEKEKRYKKSGFFRYIFLALLVGGFAYYWFFIRNNNKDFFENFSLKDLSIESIKSGDLGKKKKPSFVMIQESPGKNMTTNSQSKGVKITPSN